MSESSKLSMLNARMHGFSPAQHILAAGCYTAAMMVWIIGDRLIYFGAVPFWFVVLITSLVAASGISFNFEGVL